MISTASVVGFRLFPAFTIQSLPECMEFRRLLVSSLSRQRCVDVGARNSILFGQSVREDRCDSPVKEIENPVVNVLQPDSQFVNAVAEKVGFRASQFVPQF